jgi:glycolate oxidase FAD binding subunit
LLPQFASSAAAGVVLVRVESASSTAPVLSLPDSAQAVDVASGQTIWQALRDVEPVLGGNTAAAWLRISIAPTALVALAALVERLDDPLWYADVGGGRVWLALTLANARGAIAAVRAHVTAIGGGVAVITSDPELRREYAVFDPLPAPLAALARRVKSSFDPLRLFSPGWPWPEACG